MRALVTGAARGLGRAVAERIVRDGGELAVVDADPDIDRVCEELSVIRDEGTVLAFVADVSVEHDAEHVVLQTEADLGGLDLLVNGAGISGPPTRVVETPTDEIRHVLDVNLMGTLLVSRAAARVMIRRGTGGCIVNLCSASERQGGVGGAAYCASKGGLALLTQSLALELAPHGIRVNTVTPGIMATETHLEDLRARAEAAGTTFEEELERVQASIPLGRHGAGEDVAGAVAWLASADASYVTGQSIGVNGGVLLT
jgi:NAD(P)-dependent dehydrogenase (short-subunit alcohol dehydrogenase family)